MIEASGAEPAGGIARWAAHITESLGAPGTGLANGIDTVLPFVPSEVVLPIAGFTAGQGRMSVVAAIVWATVGSVVGSLVVYYADALLGRERTRSRGVPADALRRPAPVVTRFVRHGAGGVRLIIGVALGALTSAAELVFLLLAGPVLLVRRTPPRVVTAAVRRLAGIEAARLTALLGADETGEAADRRVLAYLTVRWPVGLLGGGVLFLLRYGAVTTIAVLAGWLDGGRPNGIAPTWPILVHLFVAATICSSWTWPGWRWWPRSSAGSAAGSSGRTSGS